MSSSDQQTIAVICIGVVELFSLGVAKAAMIGLNIWKSGIETLVLGSAITAIGYLLGLWLGWYDYLKAYMEGS